MKYLPVQLTAKFRGHLGWALALSIAMATQHCHELLLKVHVIFVKTEKVDLNLCS